MLPIATLYIATFFPAFIAVAAAVVVVAAAAAAAAAIAELVGPRLWPARAAQTLVRPRRSLSSGP